MHVPSVVPAVLLLAAAALPGLAADPAADAAAIEAALVQAKGNRPEIERFLSGAAESGDAEKAAAARFLVANMPGKGYVIFELRDEKGAAVEFDPLSFPDFKAAQARLDEIEKERGTVDFVRARMVPDLETLAAAFLRRHLDLAFESWRGAPAARRVDFATFCEFVLPYRGSEEPAEDWLGPMRERFAPVAAKLGETADAAAAWKAANDEVWKRMRFDERYYLHPTDQSFSEMEKSGMGRCEDLTNMLTFAARALGVATAADYTPAWGHSDNNHAWNVLLGPDGSGMDPVGTRAAKVYRKTYSLRSDNVASLLPPGREAANRWLGARNQMDVTDQYGPTTDVTTVFEPGRTPDETVAYVCVFNGGEWKAIHGGPIRDEAVTFTRMGRGIVYLPAVHDGKALVPCAHPLILHKDGKVESLAAVGAKVSVLCDATGPTQTSPDTKETKPVSHLAAGTRHTLSLWKDGKWTQVGEAVAGPEPLTFEGLPADGLYWLVAEGSRKLERVFTIEGGRQRFW